MGNHKKRNFRDDDGYNDEHYRNRDRNRNRNRDRDKRERYHQKPKMNTLERILTPGTTTNNVIKTAATGIIAGGTILLMGIYGFFGDSLAGASYLPMATAVSSAVATACVWIFGRPKAEQQHDSEVRELRDQIKDLNSSLSKIQENFDNVSQRLSNVEIIENFEERLANKALDQKIASSLPKYERDEVVAESSHMSPATER